MRLFPTWVHPLLAKLLPSIRKGHGYIRQAQKLLVPEILRRREMMAAGKLETGTKDTLLSWMMECADESESDPDHLAHLEIVISLAAIHTSQMNAVHVLYDLAAHPEYFEEIREEIREVVRKDSGWQKTSYAKIRKLDSFMKESQRFNPPSMLSYHRVMQENHILSDGTALPRGSHICMPVNAIQNDPEVTPNPDVFDGLRYYKYRLRHGEGHLHQFATTEKNSLNFGHGKYACPGRFFASLEIKVILVRLIMNYDFKLTPHQGRPANLKAHEFLFPNPDGELLVRKRGLDTESPF
jgi:cytochrome P450